MKKYEIMYILRTNLEDEKRNVLIGKLHDVLAVDGTIENINEWEIRDLAYEIDDEKKGYYVVVTITTSSTKGINEFDRVAKYEKSVLRHGIFRVE